MAKNWMELNLSKDEEEIVRQGAALYKTIYLDTIDNVFVIARAVKIVHERHYSSGIKGGFTAALVQYGFTSRDGGPMNKAIISHLKQLLENEAKVRTWWDTVPPRVKRDWLSAKAVYTNWKRSLKPKDPDAPRKPTPLQEERATNVILQEQLHATQERLKTADGGNLFDLEHTGAEKIGEIIVAAWRQQPSRIETLIRTLNAELKELRARIKAARPLGGLPGRRTRHGKVVKS